MAEAASDCIAGMAPTGRRVPGPAGALVELQADNGRKHLALVFKPAIAAHPWLHAELQGKLGYMERPEVSGVARLAAHDPERGALVYSTGTAWTIAEVVRACAEEGDVGGVKAGVELCYLVSQLVVEAAERGASGDCPTHGNINPWTVLLQADGQPQLIGFGLGQVELAAWQEDHRLKLSADSLRYAPPERLANGPEDISSDLFALTLVALELIMGKPVYDGLAEDIRQQASRGEGIRRLYTWRDQLPPPVRDAFSRALQPDQDTRYQDPVEFVYAVHDLLGSIEIEGPNLIELMARVRATEKRGKAAVGGHTAMLTADEMAELAADLQDFEDRALPPPRRPRPDEAAAAEETPQPPAVQRWTRQIARAGDDDAPISARERLKRRLSRSSGAVGTVEITVAGRVQHVSSPPGDTAARLALRAAVAHGAVPVDAMGRLLGVPVLAQAGQRVAGARAVADLAEGGPLEITLAPGSTRLCDVVVRTDPPTRLRTPVPLGVPCGWWVAGMAAWLGLPSDGWAVVVDETAIEPALPLGEALADATFVVVARDLTGGA